MIVLTSQNIYVFGYVTLTMSKSLIGSALTQS